jgi:uncharacterized protein YbjT (DUF2867 family)
MSQEIKNVIIVGAGGNLGPSILKALDNDPAFTVSVLGRKGSKTTYPSHIKVHEVDESWPEDQLVTALRGQDAIVQVVLADVPKAKTLIDAAIKAGVKRLLPSEYGMDTSNEDAVKLVPPSVPKREILNYLRSKEESGLTWTSLITSAFFDWGLKTKFLGFDLESRSATIYDGGDNRLSYTNLALIGAATVSILRNPDKTANKHIYIHSFKATQNEILAALEKATGEKWKTTAAQTKELRKTGEEKLAKGDFSGVFDILVAVIFGGDKIFDYATHNGLNNEELGLPKEESLEATVEQVVKGE